MGHTHNPAWYPAGAVTPALPQHHARITRKSCSMSTCAASRFHPEHPGPWGNRYREQRPYRWGKGRVGLHRPTTSPSHSFYNGAGVGHHDRCHPRTPLLCISSPKPLFRTRTEQANLEASCLCHLFFCLPPTKPPGP